MDFPSIINAVKPGLRTSQYKVLAALYSIGAATTPVTVSQVKEVLALNLGTKIPPNLPARLRQYSSDVRVASKGPPLQWLLTARGLEKLRQISGLPLPIKQEEAA